MRLRLDEMVPRSIAGELREAGHDVDAVVEHPELRGLPDQEQFDQATADTRTLVTYDTADYVPIAVRRTAEGQEHPGLILLSAARFPPGAPAAVVKASPRCSPARGSGQASLIGRSEFAVDGVWVRSSRVGVNETRCQVGVHGVLASLIEGHAGRTEAQLAGIDKAACEGRPAEGEVLVATGSQL